MKTISAVLNDKICGIINTKGKVRIISKDNEDCEFKEYIQKESELERTRENIKYYKNKIAKHKGISNGIVSLFDCSRPLEFLMLVWGLLLPALICAKSVFYFEELLSGIMPHIPIQLLECVIVFVAAFAAVGIVGLEGHIKNKLVRKSCEKKLEPLKEEKNQQEHLELLKLVIKYREYVLVKETSDGSAVYGDDEDLTKDQIRYANFHMTATLLKILRDKVNGNKPDNLGINNEEANDIISKIDNLSALEAIKRLVSGEEECIFLDLRDKKACK